MDGPDDRALGHADAPADRGAVGHLRNIESDVRGWRRKQEVALKLYEQGQASKSRAAEIASLSLWEFTELVEQRGVRWDYGLEEAKQELQRVLAETYEP